MPHLHPGHASVLHLITLMQHHDPEKTHGNTLQSLGSPGIVNDTVLVWV